MTRHVLNDYIYCLHDRYREQSAAVKLAVKVSKKMPDWRWGERLVNGFDGN